MAALEDRIRQRARELGFSAVGFAPAQPPPEAGAYLPWVEGGLAGEMGYMHRSPSRRADVREVLPGARSVVCAALSYQTAEPLSIELRQPGRGWLSRYAWGDDYHEVLGGGLASLAEPMVEEGFEARPYVDTGALLERAYAARAGLGWAAKNANLLHPELGSWFLLGLVVTTAELEPSQPLSFGCGSCRACLTACPTGAIVAPGVVDARRCISYLTIELRGAIPRELRPLVGNHVFGCDICQDVCPWNGKVEPTPEERFRARQGLVGPELVELVQLSPEAFRERFRHSAVKRAKRAGLVRNAAVALGNWGSPEAVPALCRVLEDEEPLVRGHAAWALGRIGGQEARQALAGRLEVEEDPWVRQEIELGLIEGGGGN